MSTQYMMGSCHHLAVAMHRLTGWDLGLVAGPHDGQDAILHVFCLAPDGAAWDVRGEHCVADLIEEQTAATGRDAWSVRLDGEAAVWRLAADGRLNPIHQTYVLDAVEAAESALDGAAAIASDGWSPRDRAAVSDAQAGRGPVPAYGREAALEQEASPGP